MGDTKVRRPRNRPILVNLYRETVVLRGDLDPISVERPNGMVRPVVAKGKLEGPCAEGPGDQLMSQADPKHRDAFLGHRQDRFCSLLDGGWISWTIRYEQPVRCFGQYFRGCGVSRDHSHTATEFR